MCIDDIAGLLIEFPDACKVLLLRCISCVEIGELSAHFIGNGVGTISCKALHERTVLLRIISADPVNEPLKVARNQDIHGRGAREDKFPLSVIFTGPEEVKQDFVVIGSADQLSDRKSHELSVVGRKDISEIAGRHSDVDLVAFLDFSFFQKSAVCVDIIDDLRHKTADIDGICRAELIPVGSEIRCHLRVVENLLYGSLRIIKVAVDRDNARIIAALCDHLKSLNIRHTAVREKYHDLCSRHIRKTGHRSLSGIT